MITEYNNRISILKMILEVGLRECVKLSTGQGSSVFLDRMEKEFMPIAQLITKLDDARKDEDLIEQDLMFIIDWIFKE